MCGSEHRRRLERGRRLRSACKRRGYSALLSSRKSKDLPPPKWNGNLTPRFSFPPFPSCPITGSTPALPFLPGLTAPKFASQLDSFAVELCERVCTCPVVIPPDEERESACAHSTRGRRRRTTYPAPASPPPPHSHHPPIPPATAPISRFYHRKTCFQMMTKETRRVRANAAADEATGGGVRERRRLDRREYFRVCPRRG